PFLVSQIVGMVPPSMTYSLPVIEDARSETRNATNSATSSGRFGRPSGIPPSDFIKLCRAPAVSVPPLYRQPLDQSLGGFCLSESGRNTNHADAMRGDFLGEPFAVVGKSRFGGGVSQGGFE